MVHIEKNLTWKDMGLLYVFTDRKIKWSHMVDLPYSLVLFLYDITTKIRVDFSEFLDFDYWKIGLIFFTNAPFLSL